MYKESLTRQWENLVSDFTVEHQKQTALELNAGRIAAWYDQRVKRFSSLVMMEGMELDHLGKPEFAAELRAKIAAFQFSQRAADQTFSINRALAVNAVPALATGVLIAVFTDWPILWPIGIGVVLLMLGVSRAFSQAEAARRKAAAALLAEYAGQLERYLPELMAICDRHGIQ